MSEKFTEVEAGALRDAPAISGEDAELIKRTVCDAVANGTCSDAVMTARCLLNAFEQINRACATQKAFGLEIGAPYQSLKNDLERLRADLLSSVSATAVSSTASRRGE